MHLDATEQRFGVVADDEWYGVSICCRWRVSDGVVKIGEHVVLFVQCLLVQRCDGVGDGVLADEACNDSHLFVSEIAIKL